MSGVGRIRGSHGFDADVDMNRIEDSTTGDLLLRALEAHTATPVTHALHNLADDLHVLSVAYESGGDVDGGPLVRLALRIEVVAELARRLYGESAYERDDAPRRESA